MSSTFQYPEAFDTSLGVNFTNPNCPKFFQTFLADQSFVQCYPMSFYLQNSQSYVVLVRNQGIAGVQQVLASSCSADLGQCQQTMLSYGSQILSDSNCGQDFDNGNPLVTQAYQDFITYRMTREATCLPLSVNSTINYQKRDSLNSTTIPSGSNSTSTNSTATNATAATYCYTDALYNPLDVSDAFLYLLPYGISYPSTSLPSCSACTQRVMSLFHNYTGNSSYQISYSYESGSSLINSECGSNFVNASGNPLPSASTSAKKNAAERPAFSMYYAILLIVFASFIL
jgi:hypothetical protein